MSATRDHDESNTSADEVLDTGGPTRSVRLRWWLLALIVAGTVAVLLVLSVRQPAARQHGGPSTPTPSDRPTAPTSRASASSSRASASPTPSAPSTRPAASPCAGVADCVVRSAVPPAIDALARKKLATDVSLRVRTALVPGSTTRRARLVERDLEAHFQSVTVVIRLDHHSDPRTALVADPPGVGSLLLHRTNAGYTVRLQYLAPDTVAPRLTELIAFMRDPQLTRV